MFDTLKKHGVPATVAAVISALVTVTPFLFKLDERYAKDDDLKAQAERTERALHQMNNELGKLAGTQEALVLILSNQSRLVERATSSEAAGAPTGVPAAPVTTPAPPRRLDDVSRQLREQRTRIEGFKY